MSDNNSGLEHSELERLFKLGCEVMEKFSAGFFQYFKEQEGLDDAQALTIMVLTMGAISTRTAHESHQRNPQPATSFENFVRFEREQWNNFEKAYRAHLEASGKSVPFVEPPPPTELRIEHDDQAGDIVEKVNMALKDKNLPVQFVSDDQAHDGFEIYTLEIQDHFH